MPKMQGCVDIAISTLDSGSLMNPALGDMCQVSTHASTCQCSYTR